jgi:hypothetical protein
MTQPKPVHPIDQGAASILITKEEGTIEVRHGEDNTLLAFLENAPAGTWNKLWKTFRKLGFTKLYR